MKRYFDTAAIDGLKEKIVVLKEKDDDKKTIYLVIAVIAVALIAVAMGVVYLLNNKMEDEYEDEWDYDWDDLDDDACCCTDSDVDDTVEIEKI